MLITFNCRHCKAKLRINANAMGSGLNCPECEGDIHVPEMKLGPGFVLGGFLIKHKVGEGGMGEVYLARQLSLERDVALKILPEKFTRENSFIVRFLKEVHYQARLDHPNIVAAYDAGEDNGVYFMAMAFVAGETLEEKLNREATIPESAALQVVRQVAMALQYASEEKGILHRDIKPANVMVTPSLHAKVLDMGLSKNTLEKNSTTLADTLLGTPNYMSPEQIDHPQDIDTRSDMFSLGMTLYHMLTGQVPYEDTSYLKTLKRHAKEPLEDPRDLIPGVSEGVARFLCRTLARDPDDRYEDWDAFLEDLRGLQSGGLPTLPEGESSLDFSGASDPVPDDHPVPEPEKPSSTPDRRHPAGIILSVIIGLLLGLGGITIMVQVMGARTRSVPPQPAPTATLSSLPTPTPSPVPTPTRDLAGLRAELTSVILDYERNPGRYEETRRELAELGSRGAGTDIAEQAARMIVRIRRDRDEAVEAAIRNLRERSLRILYDQGAEAARRFLSDQDSPFPDETARVRRNLLRRVEIWERQERSQREEEERQARRWLGELKNRLAPLVEKRDWAGALEMVNEAAEEPSLFAASEDVAGLRSELLVLQDIPGEVMDSYRRSLNRPTTLKLHDGEVSVEIREVQAEGLVVGKTIFDEAGTPVGTTEQILPFSDLSADEVLDRLENLEGAAADIYRALTARRGGDPVAARDFLEKADSPLAETLIRHWYAPLTLEETPEPSGEETDLNRPRFVPRPSLESP